MHIFYYPLPCNNRLLLYTQNSEKNKSGILVLKNYMKALQKNFFRKIKSQASDWEKIFVKYISDKGLIPRIFKIFLNSV